MAPNPLLTIFDLSIYPYGLMIGISIMLCLLVFFTYTKKKDMPTQVQDFTFIIAIIGIAVGFLFAKLYQAFYDFIESGVFDFYNAGLTVMGGLIGGAAAFIASYFLIGHFYFKNKTPNLHKQEFNKIILVAPLCILIAHGFGRLGCLMAGCCHGAYLGEDYVFGGIWMEGTVAIGDTGRRVSQWGYYVPTQLYEALFLFALFGVLSYLLLKKNCNIIMHIYLIAYGIWRIIIEFFRADNRGFAADKIQPSQWQSIVFILLGVGLIIFYVVKKIPLILPKKVDGAEDAAKPVTEDK